MSRADELRAEADALYASAQASNRLNDRDRADIRRSIELRREADRLDGKHADAPLVPPTATSGQSKSDKMKAALADMAARFGKK